MDNYFLNKKIKNYIEDWKKVFTWSYVKYFLFVFIKIADFMDNFC